jgi:hypothetical protein
VAALGTYRDALPVATAPKPGPSGPTGLRVPRRSPTAELRNGPRAPQRDGRQCSLRQCDSVLRRVLSAATVFIRSTDAARTKDLHRVLARQGTACIRTCANRSNAVLCRRNVRATPALLVSATQTVFPQSAQALWTQFLTLTGQQSQYTVVSRTMVQAL